MKKIVLILIGFLFVGKIFAQCSMVVFPNDTSLNNTVGLCGVSVNYVLPSIVDTCSVILFEDFENGAPGWQSGTLGALDNWTIQNSSGTGNTFGSNMYGVPHSGNWSFGGAEYSYIQSPLFNTVGGGTISFDYYVNNEPAFHDKEIIKLSFDGGATWTQLLGDQLPNDAVNIQTINLPITANEGTFNTLIRFEYNTVDACCGAQDGFFIDNVKFEKAVIVQQISGLGSGAVFPIGTTTEMYSILYGGVVDTVSFTINVNSIYNTTQSFTICYGESITVGNSIYATTGNYFDTLITTIGCDSIVTTELLVKNEIDTSLTVNNYLIASNEYDATYQWINVANNNAIINGEINQDFLTNGNGTYAVVINKEGCEKTSSTVNIIPTEVEEEELSLKISVYPNPAKNKINFSLNNDLLKTEAVIVDVTGKVIYEMKEGLNKINTIDLTYISSGVYFLRIYNSQKMEVIKFVKQ